jgi:hypothetical protein
MTSYLYSSIYKNRRRQSSAHLAQSNHPANGAHATNTRTTTTRPTDELRHSVMQVTSSLDAVSQRLSLETTEEAPIDTPANLKRFQNSFQALNEELEDVAQ